MKMLRTDRLLALAVALLSMANAGFAQGNEQIVPLRGNPMLREAHRHMEAHRPSSAAPRAAAPLTLPFFDDFSERFSRERGHWELFPDTALWIGDNVYINDHMAINPMSVGVATFDGLDGRGLAYGFGLAIPLPSDTLTSKPIALDTSMQGVYLSFHYQAQGHGLAPSATDRLVLEFKDTADIWQEVWAAAGYTLTDSAFKRAMLPIDTAFLHNDFQFQFVNHAARAGAVDHWHVDYIYLNEGRTEADTIFLDVAIVEGTASLLANYQSMPWEHYEATAADSSQMALKRYFMLRNHRDAVATDVSYTTRVVDVLDAQQYSSLSAQVDVPAYIVCGNEFETIPSGGCGADDFGSDLIGFQYPLTPVLSSDSNYFYIETTVNYSGDGRPSNNKVLHKQEFYNYYAHDDGTAELGYGLGNLQFFGEVSIQFHSLKADHLRAIQYYLNPVAEDLSNEPVRFIVRNNNAGVPGDIIYQSKEFTLDYSSGINYMNHFMLTEENADIYTENIEGIQDEFYIGWEQHPVAGQKFSIGFDRNNDTKEKTFYSIGSAPWSQSSISGAVMFRPVFGEAYTWTGVEDRPLATVLIAYPNPSTGYIFLKENVSGEFAQATISLYDVAGRVVLQQKGYANGIDASSLRNGLYILEVVSVEGQRSTQRIVLQP